MNRMGRLVRGIRPSVAGQWLAACTRERSQVSSFHTALRRRQDQAHAQTAPTAEDQSCSRYPVPEIDALPLDMQQRIREVEEKSHFVPNVFKALAYRPDEFRAFFSYYDALMEKESDTLTKAEKEMIVVATSGHNQCLYCVVAHSALHRIYSKNRYISDQLAVNWETADISDRERAILKFAMELCKAVHVSDSQIKELQLHGLTDDDIWDVGAITAFFALSNRMAHLTRMRPNPEFNIMGRIKHEKKK